MYRCLSLELAPQGILVGSVRPGVVATPMQDGIREHAGPEEHFPMKKKFLDLHETGKLEDPENVATFFHWLLSDVDDGEFGASEWDFRNSRDDERWTKYSSS